MKSSHNQYLIRCLCLLAIALQFVSCSDAVTSTTEQPAAERVSAFGVYKGYTPARFHEWVTNSQYIETRDGTRLAADITRPAIDGVAVKEAFPVLWTYSRYHRRWEEAPNIDSEPVLQRLLRHGYVIVCVNVRGGGASFGRYEGLFSAKETQDAYDVIDWLSKQPFSDGNVGMYGVSYMAITQYMAASTRHPALKAITPENGYFNFYDALRPGGILRDDMVRTWADGTRYLDKERPPIPVDADVDGAMAAAAVLGHADNFDPIAPTTTAKFRDSTAPEFDWLSDMPSAVMDNINASGAAIYHLGGWHDPYALDTLLLEANYTGPDKLAMGPWAHVTSTDEEAKDWNRVWEAEMHRWFDHWLKRIDNGVATESRIHVAVVDTPQKSWSWMPLKGLPGDDDRVSLFLSDASAVENELVPGDRQLIRRMPGIESAIDYTVDPATTTGTATRWDSNFGTHVAYPDMTENDNRSVTFTTPPLEKDLVVVGAPVIRLYLSASTPDADVHAVLEEVEDYGRSTYVTEGMLRASLRKESDPPWNNLGLPWHRAYRQDRQLLVQGEVVELAFPMQPVAYRFNRGNRIRVAIMGADADNTEPPPYADATLSIQVGGEHASRLSIPVLTTTAE